MATKGSRKLRLGLGLFLVLGLLGLPGAAAADPGECEGEHREDDGEHGHVCFTQEEIDSFDDSGPVLPANALASENMALRANLPKTGDFTDVADFNSDLAFWGNYAIQGNYDGFQIFDISNPGQPRMVSQMLCPGSQNDVSVWRNLIFTSTDSSRNKAECEGNVPQSATIAESWEGIRVFDWTDPANPTYVTAVETDCGSHTHTLLPERTSVLIYVSSYSPSSTFPDCQPPHDKISVVEVPLRNPTAAAVIAEPVLFPDGGAPGTSGCHDITVYQALRLAAGACMGQGSMLDISDPENPVEISRVTDPNFAFWHSASFSNNGRTVVFTDELGGGGGPTCNPTIGPNRGADAFYNMRNPRQPVLMSYFKIPRTQSNTENCVAHNGNILPIPGRDIMVQAWYQGGTSVIDFTDPANPKELAWIDRGPISDTQLVLGGHWSSYWYNGHIFGSEIQRGFDVMTLFDPVTSRARTWQYHNPQTQEPLPRF